MTEINLVFRPLLNQGGYKGLTMRDWLRTRTIAVRSGLFLLVVAFLMTACVTPVPQVCYNAQIHTVDNEQINLCDFKLFEKNHNLETTAFRARWRESLDLVAIPFDEIASARKIGRYDTRIRFRDGTEDDFSELFVDEYILKGWSAYGLVHINATLVRGVVFVDDQGNPVGGEGTGYIPPLVPPSEEEDRLVTFEGDIISGRLMAGEFTIRTAYGALTLDRDVLSEIMVDREAEVMKQVAKLKNGDIISGFIDPSRVSIIAPGDQVVTLDIDQLSRIRFSRPVASADTEER